MEDVDIADASKALYEAPFGILAHKMPEAGEDHSEPTFVYANQVLASLSSVSSLPSCRTLHLLGTAPSQCTNLSCNDRETEASCCVQVALDLFETSWDELIGQPSSVSADPEVPVGQCTAVAASHVFAEQRGILLSVRDRSFKACVDCAGAGRSGFVAGRSATEGLRGRSQWLAEVAQGHPLQADRCSPVQRHITRLRGRPWAGAAPVPEALPGLL